MKRLALSLLVGGLAVGGMMGGVALAEDIAQPAEVKTHACKQDRHADEHPADCKCCCCKADEHPEEHAE